MKKNTFKDATDESDSDVKYNLARSIVARHGLRKIPAELATEYLWTADDISVATGLGQDEIQELVETGCVRFASVFGPASVTLRDDILDLLGVRWPLPGDTQDSYLERCDFVGVWPDLCQIPRRDVKAETAVNWGRGSSTSGPFVRLGEGVWSDR